MLVLKMKFFPKCSENCWECETKWPKNRTFTWRPTVTLNLHGYNTEGKSQHEELWRPQFMPTLKVSSTFVVATPELLSRRYVLSTKVKSLGYAVKANQSWPREQKWPQKYDPSNGTFQNFRNTTPGRNNHKRRLQLANPRHFNFGLLGDRTKWPKISTFCF